MDIRDRALELKNVYPNYKIKMKYWYLLGAKLQPNKTTIIEIKIVMEMYEYPKNPSEMRWSCMEINFKGLPSTSVRRKLNCITNKNHMIKRKKLSDDNENVYDYQGCVINVVSILYISYLSAQV